MIDDEEPSTWRDLQSRVARILTESGVTATVEKTITTARGSVEVDVWAHDPGATSGQTYLVECKKWRASVPKSFVHSFRTVVGDSGASWGAIVSANGFQQGAYEAARYSNVRLLSWREFQELFAIRWYAQHFLPTVSKACDPLIEYTEPINSRIFRKADALPELHRKAFKQLRQEHVGLGSLSLLFRAEALGLLETLVHERYGRAFTPVPPKLPLRPVFEGVATLPDAVLDAVTLRGLLGAVLLAVESATAAFDRVFGERA